MEDDLHDSVKQLAAQLIKLGQALQKLILEVTKISKRVGELEGKMALREIGL